MAVRFPELTVQKGAALYLAVLLLFVPLRLLVGFFVAALVHELCHVAALVVLGHPVYGIFLGISGARIKTELLSPRDEFICALAGPLGALLVFSIARWIPTVCLFVLLQSLYNLIPLYPMDGGRALRSVCGVWRYGKYVFAVLEIATCSLILALGFWAAFRLKLGILPLAASLCMVFPALCEK